ncbi:MAG TPA: transcriptional regulator [Lichenihabitans sp.]|jgi:hypothetical protein|nr:transcriptional regulator [Lichenihabitans sp.]
MTEKAGDLHSRVNAKSDKARKMTRESDKVWAQYEAEGRAIRARTERLRSLRLAKEAADSNAAPPPVAVRKSRKKTIRPGAAVAAAVAKEPSTDL